MGKQKRKFGPRGARGWKTALMGGLFRLAALGAIWGGVAVAVLLAYYAIDLPDVHQVVQPQRRPSITLQAEDGTVFARYGDLYGQHVTLDNVPKYLPQAIISIEDRRFYQHPGIDVFGMMRAAFQNLRAGHVVQGGSTLTQQLAKNLFLTPERTFKRKIQEMMLAIWMEHIYTKNEILTAYLNRVYLGAGTYGVDAASQVYFGKPVHDINLHEAAILAGLLRAPSRFSPLHDQAQANARAQTVLAAMVDAGYITEKQKKVALSAVPPPKRKPGAGGDGRYFADWVVDQIGGLAEDTTQDLVVVTTLDLDLQRMAERHIDAVLSKANDREASQAALVTLSPDGAVRAMAGGRNYQESQFNRATQAMRQPGSAFKPIVYLAAIQQGLAPSDIIEDAPISIGRWSPENFDNKYRGPVTAREALAESINTVAVRVMQKAGVGNVIQTAQALGVTSPMERELSLALGTNVLTPLELTSVYASLAAGGRAIAPYAIKKIDSRDGQTLYVHPDVNAPQVVDSGAVSTLVDMMQDVVRYGTGKRAALDRPVAGKTGTSSDYRDAWFLGFTGDYTTGVWLGNDDNHPMKKITGGSLPAALWHDYMMEAEASRPSRELLSGYESHYAGGSSGAATSELSKAFNDFIHNVVDAPTVVEHSYPDQKGR